MQTVAGKLIGMEINDAFIDCETSCSFQFNIEMLAANNPDSGRWNSFIPGYGGWTASVDGNLLLNTSDADFKTLLTAAKNGSRVKISISTKADGSLSIWGYGYIDSGTLNAAISGKANWTVTFTGDGDFFLDSNPFLALIINAMPAQSDKPNVVDTTI